MLIAVSGLLVGASLSSCATPGAAPGVVDPDSMDVASWSESILGKDHRMSFAGSHRGADASGGSFYDVEPGWYEVTMACAGGDDMSLELEADGDPVGNGITSCNSSAVKSSIELRQTASELTLQVSNSGDEMLWAVGLVPSEEPEETP